MEYTDKTLLKASYSHKMLTMKSGDPILLQGWTFQVCISTLTHRRGRKMSQGYSVISWDRKDWKEGNTADYNGEEEEMWK